MQKPANPFDYYTKINLNLWTDDQNFSALVEHIQEQSPKVGNPVIRKKHLTVVLANLYYTWVDDPDKYIGFYRFVNKYKAHSMYNILHISKLIIAVIDTLVELNYVDYKRGFYGRGEQSPHSKKISRMRSNNELIKLFTQFKLQPDIIELLPSTPCIILRDIKDNKKEEMDYAVTKELDSLRTSLVRYNNLLRKTHIAIPHYPKEGIIRSKEIKIPYNPHNKFVRRVFNNGTFKDGGRFYGGFWQIIPKEYRAGIHINGEPIFEFDYSGLHIHLLYALENKRCIGDPYSLQHPRYSDGELRPYLKQLLLIMINCRKQKQVLNAVRNAIQWEEQLSSYSAFNHGEFIELLADKHKPIQKYLYSGYGIKLQNTDATIAHNIIETLTKREIPVLCVHDSFICSFYDIDDLTEEMCLAYKSIPSSRAMDLTYKMVAHSSLKKDDPMYNGRVHIPDDLFKQHQQRQWKDHYK